MKCLKEPLSRMVNREERCTGAFFEGRFKSIAILDEEALLSVAAYIDLNPVAAGIAKTPEESEHTSVRRRVESVRSKGRLDDLKAALQGSVAGSRALGVRGSEGDRNDKQGCLSHGEGEDDVINDDKKGCLSHGALEDGCWLIPIEDRRR